MEQNETTCESSVGQYCGGEGYRAPYSLFPYGVWGLLICVSLLTVAWFKRKRVQKHWIKRTFWVGLALLFLFSLFCVFLPTQMDRSYFAFRVAWHCYGLVEKNILNRGYHFGERNTEIIVPLSEKGTFVDASQTTDLWVELSSRGRISIHNATLTKRILGLIVKNRVERYGDYRVYIWADQHAATNDFNDVVQILTTNGCSDLFRVVAEPRRKSKKVDYKVIRIEDQSSQPEDK